MKYLSSYKLFESVKDISTDIKDILVYLEDDGYETSVSHYPNGNKVPIGAHEDFHYDYMVLLVNDQNGYSEENEPESYKPTLDRLILFMEKEGYPYVYKVKSFQGRAHMLYFDRDQRSHLKEAKKLDPETNFKGIIDDVFVELREKGFIYYITSNKTTHSIKITFRDRHSKSSNPITTFKFKDIKEDIVMLVNYLSDIYPKISFNQFNATVTHRASEPRRRTKWDDRGVQGYTLKDFLNKIDDKDTLENINIQCLVRFRGKF